LQHPIAQKSQPSCQGNHQSAPRCGGAGASSSGRGGRKGEEDQGTQKYQAAEAGREETLLNACAC